MYYVGLFFQGITQSWGGENGVSVNRESPRTTVGVPTKSAVIGLIRSSLGVPRGGEDDYSLRKTRLITRTDTQGKIIRDYQIAQRTHHGYTAGDTKEIPKQLIEDGTYTVLLGFEQESTMESIAEALLFPKWSLYSGRRSNVFSLPIYLGNHNTENPRKFLEELPIIWSPKDATEKTVRFTDSTLLPTDSNYQTLKDEVLSWDMKEHLYGSRVQAIYNKKYTKPETVDSLTEQYINLKEKFNVSK